MHGEPGKEWISHPKRNVMPLRVAQKNVSGLLSKRLTNSRSESTLGARTALDNIVRIPDRWRSRGVVDRFV